MSGPEETRPNFEADRTREAPTTPPGSTRPVSPDSPTLDQSSAPAVGYTGWLAPGDRVGSYLVQRVIGEGGFGVVYEAEQHEPIRRTVALKVLKPGMDTREIIVRFEGERQALALLDHPGIAKILDAGVTSGGRPYFAMELVSGVPITRYCDDEKLTLRDRVKLMEEVCEAVQHAHQRGIIHRDIKPSNILVHRESDRPDAGARARIIDFGIAKATTPGVVRAQTLEGYCLGTPEYMSPEQAGTGGVDADVRSDVYSLGVTLYELLTGSLPIEPPAQGAAMEMLRRVRDEDPVRPSDRFGTRAGKNIGPIAERRREKPATLARELRGDFDWILLKALEKDRERRYASARDLALDLERALTGRPVLAGPPSALYRAGKFARRHRLALAAAGAVLLALVVGLGMASYGFMQARHQRDIAVLEREKSELAAAAARRAKSEAEQQAEAATRARAEAVHEAETALAVRNFLQEMIAAGDPEKGATPDMTVSRVIDQAAERLDAGSLKDRPSVEAEVRQTLGDAYLSLGLSEKAEHQIRKTIDLRRQSGGEESVGYAEALNSLAFLLDDLAKYDEAEKYYREVVASFEKMRDKEPFNLATAKNNLATLLRRTNRLEEAETQWRDALKLMRSVPGQEHPTLGQTIGNLGLCLRQQHRLDEAEALDRESLEILRKSEGESSPSVARAISNLASILQDKRDYEAAEPLFVEALDMQRRFFTGPHKEVATALNNLGILYSDTGRPEKAIPLLEEAYSMSRTALGEQHPETIFGLMNVGFCRFSLGQLERAEADLDRAATEARGILGDSHSTTARCLFGLADVRVERGDFKGAEKAAREAIDVYQKLGMSEDAQSTGAMLVLCDVLVRTGRAQEGRALAGRAVEIRRKVVPRGDWLLWQAESALGSAMAAAGDPAGVSMMKDAAEPIAAGRGAPRSTVRRCFDRLAWQSRSVGDAGGAAAYEARSRALTTTPVAGEPPSPDR